MASILSDGIFVMIFCSYLYRFWEYVPAICARSRCEIPNSSRRFLIRSPFVILSPPTLNLIISQKS
nr:MAG TPA: hypothetical protein [Caudoviricetes sp.]